MVEIRTTSTKIFNGSLWLDAYLAEPIATGSYPAIVVIQEVYGVNAHIRDVTERIAKEGYVAIAPAIYQRTAPKFEVGYSEEELELGRFHKDQTKADELLSDIQSTIAHLRMLPSVEQAEIGVIGFCFGGHVAYLAATLPEITATACFYGAGIPVMTPGGGVPTIIRTPDIKGTVYGFFGTQDPLIPEEQIDQIEDALHTHGIRHQIFRYPAGHGFFCDRRDGYSAIAATDAWEHVKELFGRLKP
ncbi:dienelactone hydrolase family protein [Myxacorys almedinensis]|uniref:Dienelactone hydrolase family protein n=1 Tax=Myxacorys almedinensis A TaxID=2690445 RepID=A0A8J8CGS9_9CYAN|nr:dienelactone hydrolase family protein [Myxacorys almedinensis]NDJ16053.1 dienelactone hydrolase family protein [Myxacorys almedinensis A]